LDYLAHALLEVRREATGDDRAAAVHALDDVSGDGRVRLAEHVDPALAPAALLGSAARGPRVVVAGGGGAELLLLGVDAAVQAEVRDAVALRRHVCHRAVQELLEAAQCELPARARAEERPSLSDREWKKNERGSGRAHLGWRWRAEGSLVGGRHAGLLILVGECFAASFGYVQNRVIEYD
jgi:hypothetical protein